MTHSVRSLIRSAVLASLACAALIPSPAKAWFRGGVFIGFPPVVVGPPVVAYPPPYYYAPPYYAPGYYAPPAYPAPQAYAPPPASEAPPPNPAPQMSQAVPLGTTCYAGVYVCRAPAQSPVDSGCSCPGIGAPSYGVVR